MILEFTVFEDSTEALLELEIIFNSHNILAYYVYKFISYIKLCFSL